MQASNVSLDKFNDIPFIIGPYEEAYGRGNAVPRVTVSTGWSPASLNAIVREVAAPIAPRGKVMGDARPK
jgi:hypothetical protein